MENPCKRLKQQVFIAKQVQSVERLALHALYTKEEEETATVWQMTATSAVIINTVFVECSRSVRPRSRLALSPSYLRQQLRQRRDAVVHRHGPQL
jgi:hypothetical protein